MKIVYVDNNATTQVAEEVLDALLPYMRESYGNPSSMHSFGGNVGSVIEQAREQVAKCIGAQYPTEIVFTSCGTESDNTAIRSAVATKKDRKKIVTTRVEHPAILNTLRHLEREGYSVRYLPVDKKGLLSLDTLRAAMDESVALVTIMAANNETGVVFPIDEIGKIAHEYGALFHTDAVQAIGKIPVNVQSGNIDFLSLSGHKIHSPKGVGALYVRRGCRYKPFMLGGHQERGRRGGTLNVPGIVALGKSAELAILNLENEQTVVKKLRDRLETELLKIPLSVVNGDEVQRLPGTLNISFKNVEGEALLLLMDQVGICASSGSACTSGTLEPSHVLRAMGVPFEYAHGSVRFSLSRYNTDEDVDVILKQMPIIIERLREISPFKN